MTKKCRKDENPLFIWENHGEIRTYCDKCHEIWRKGKYNESPVPGTFVHIDGVIIKESGIFWMEFDLSNFRDDNQNIEMYKIEQNVREWVLLNNRISIEVTQPQREGNTLRYRVDPFYKDLLNEKDPCRIFITRILIE